MKKIFFLLNIFYFNVSLIETLEPLLGKLPNTHCFVYIQSFDDFVNFKEPSYVIHASCKYCIVYKLDKDLKQSNDDKENTESIIPINEMFNSIAFGCIGEGYDESLILTQSSLIPLNDCYLNDENNDNMFYCTNYVCCCRGFDCHNKLKNKARLNIITNQDQKCFIERKLLNENNVELQNEYNSNAYMNYHCSACGLVFKDNYFETLCIEEINVEISCGEFVNFIGGKLACNNDGTNCCCRDKSLNCNEAFRYYVNNDMESLGKPSISSPYTNSSNIFILNFWWIIIFFNYF
uniref:UPAR/Ly6 domain-containing protein n=1 Tax=Strongyloides stercoralis TaxID=6248 RepID=A0A0K0EHV2_STRER